MSEHTGKRDYAQERRTAIARGETGVGSKSGDAQRHRARRIAAKKFGKDAIKGKDIDHKRTIKSGGTNSEGNLRIRTVKENRSDGGKSGSRSGKAAGARKGALSST